MSSGVVLTAGDVVSCSSQRALSYRWTHFDDDSEPVIHAKTVRISQPGTFNYQCTVFVECRAGEICSRSKNISGFAGGIIFDYI